MAHHLTDEQVQAYRREGFIVIPSVFSADELQRIDQLITDMAKSAIASGDYSRVMELEPDSIKTENPVPRRIYNPYEQHEAFRGMASDPRVLDRIESLIGPNIAIHHSKLNMKPAKVGSVVEWHQDLAYFPHTNDDLVTTLIYLDDATEENGCLQVMARHHTHYFDHTLPDGTFAGMITEPIEDGRFGKPINLPAPAGSVIFMHCITPHSSLPNRSSKPRRTLIYEYRAMDSFPIYFGPYIANLEKGAHPLRGKATSVARFGGPNPYIPKMPGDNKSLYTLQAEAKAAGKA
jgi:ectoine hydroxylase-related dioxygenase (phytanoyl-CoA dioxygenase family)